MTPFEWFAVGSMLVSAFAGLGGTLWSNKKNEDLQREAWEKQSISHRVQELQANGLNKQLATGMNPNYSLQAHMESPDLNLGKVADFIGAQSSRENIRQETQNKEKQKELIEAQTDEAKARAEIAQHDAKIFLDRPYASTDPAFLRNISGIKNLLLGEDSGINSMADAIDKGLDLLYQLGDKNTKRIISNNRYKYEKMGGVSKHGKDPNDHVIGGSGQEYYLKGSSANARAGNIQSNLRNSRFYGN